MMKKILLVILMMVSTIILLSSCDEDPFLPPPFTPTQNNTQLTIEIVPTNNFSALEKLYGFERLEGLTKFNDNKGNCTIYITMLTEVRDPYAMCVAGHELFHCTSGQYHKKNEPHPCSSLYSRF